MTYVVIEPLIGGQHYREGKLGGISHEAIIFLKSHLYVKLKQFHENASSINNLTFREKFKLE